LTCSAPVVPTNTAALCAFDLIEIDGKRRFPPPWSVEEGQTWFVVKDNGGQKLAYVHFDDPRSAAKPLTRDEARRDCSQYRQAAGAVAEAAMS
jgi:hypothetical protein